MTGSVEDLLKGMRSLLGAIDNAAVSATRAQADAQQAQGRYQQAATGTAHPVLVRAVAAARTAADKAGRTARLLAKSADAYTAYVNKIAPGAVVARHFASDALPDGEALVTSSAGRSLSRRLAQRIKETRIRMTASNTQQQWGTMFSRHLMRVPWFQPDRPQLRSLHRSRSGRWLVMHCWRR